MGLASRRDLGRVDSEQTSGSKSSVRIAGGGGRSGSIDQGSWVISNVSLLEAPPPYQQFSHHQQPSPQEQQYSALYDSRWADIFLGHLKEVDSYVDAKKKLSGKGNPRRSTRRRVQKPKQRLVPRRRQNRKPIGTLVPSMLRREVQRCEGVSRGWAGSFS